MKLVIIESCGANFLSVTTAFERLGVSYHLSNDARVIKAADAVILPGVGSAGFAMQKLHEDGLIDVIRNLKQPVLGICLGMQLLYDFSEEDNVECLGIISGKITKFPNKNSLIIPHMGWNNLQAKTHDPIISDLYVNELQLNENSGLLSEYKEKNETHIIFKQDVYFVHSYYAPITQATIASTEYGINFTAIAGHNNFYGMQFHPEKSGWVGAKLLENFIRVVI
jgi:glutamine amidotransferase